MLKRLAAWKYGIAIVVILGCSVYVSRQDQKARCQYQQKCTQLNASAVSPSAQHEDCDKGAENIARHLPRWYRVFGWPEGITTWAILLTLLVIAEQTAQTRRAAFAAEDAAKAANQSAGAQMDADRAWILAKVIGSPEEPLTGNLFKGITPGIAWELEVFGNTPARIMRIDICCRLVDSSPTNAFEPMLEPVPTYIPDNEPEGQIIYPPGEKLTYMRIVETEPGTILSERLAQVVLGFAFLVSYGRVEYEDAFKRKGTSQFCAIYRPRRRAIVTSPDGTPLNPPGFLIAGPPGYNYST